MMGAAFRALGIDATFRAIDVTPGEFASVLEKLKESGVSGLNVTMPYKGTVIGHLDSLDVVSSRVRAVNTVRKEAGGYRGFNTDVHGILRPLKSRGMDRVMAAAVLGSGGAARAFVGAMNGLGCQRLTVISRRPRAASKFLAEMRGAFPSVRVKCVPSDAIGPEKFELLFNASPCGANGTPLPPGLTSVLEGSPTVFDAVYSPVETELVREAKERRCPVIYGHEMLLHQGAEGFRVWTGAAPPIPAMRDALMASLEVPA